MGNRASRLGGLCPTHTPLQGSVLHTPPRPRLLPPLLRPLLWSSHYIPCGPSPPWLWGCGFIHTSLLAPSQQPAAGWQGLGRRPARSALPRQSGTTLVSPQGPSSCSPLALPPASRLAPPMLCRPEHRPLHGQGSIYCPLNPLRRVCSLVTGVRLTLSRVQPTFIPLTQTLHAEKPAEPQLQCRASGPRLPVTRILSALGHRLKRPSSALLALSHQIHSLHMLRIDRGDPR